MATNHNGNTQKRNSYRACSYIFLAIIIISFAHYAMDMYTSYKEYVRVEEENKQISEYNEQLTLNGDTTTPRQEYVSVDSEKYDMFEESLTNIIFLGIGGIGYSFFKRKADKLTSGIQGETIVTNALNQLTNEYQVLDNVQISSGERHAEIDSLVLSKYGIWIIEVKNHKGTIRGDVNSPVWVQDKISSGGNKYTSELKNPLKQANRQMGILKEMLQQNGVNAYINTMVVFPSASSVNVNSDKVFSNMSDLNNSIRESTKVRFSQVKLNDIKSILSKI